VRLCLFESLLLSALGAIAGFGVARLCLDILPALGATNLPLDGDVTITPAVLWATASVALATGVLMGIYPAPQAARPSASRRAKGRRTRRLGRSVGVPSFAGAPARGGCCENAKTQLRSSRNALKVDRGIAASSSTAGRGDLAAGAFAG
jgi:hypothetical protein